MLIVHDLEFIQQRLVFDIVVGFSRRGPYRNSEVSHPGSCEVQMQQLDFDIKGFSLNGVFAGYFNV